MKRVITSALLCVLTLVSTVALSACGQFSVVGTWKASHIEFYDYTTQSNKAFDTAAEAEAAGYSWAIAYFEGTLTLNESGLGTMSLKNLTAENSSITWVKEEDNKYCVTLNGTEFTFFLYNQKLELSAASLDVNAGTVYVTYSKV